MQVSDSIFNIVYFSNNYLHMSLSWPNKDFKRDTLSDKLSLSELSKLTENMSV